MSAEIHRGGKESVGDNRVYCGATMAETMEKWRQQTTRTLKGRSGIANKQNRKDFRNSDKYNYSTQSLGSVVMDEARQPQRSY